MESGETTVATSATTDASGNYALSLNPGTYVVCEVLQSGWTQSFPTGNTKCAAVSGLGQAGYALTVSSNSSEIGRASCRERVEITAVEASIQQKDTSNEDSDEQR